MTYSPAAERNKGPILDALKPFLKGQKKVLEIGSGSGQHAQYFTQHLDILWQPSDIESKLPQLTSRPDNLLPPIELDVGKSWPKVDYDTIYTANTLHIMSWSNVLVFLDNVIKTLPDTGKLCFYGPFKENNEFNTESNRAFDQQLRNRDPLSGIRDMEKIDWQLENSGIYRVNKLMMPANNYCLLYEKS